MIPAAALVLLVSLQEKPLATLPENASDVVVNADLSSVAWVEGGRRVAFNGTRGREFDEVRFLRLSRAGDAVAYAARTGAQWSVVSGETASAPYDEVGEPVLSGGAVAFAARRGKVWVAVLGGTGGPEFDAVTSLALRPNGKTLAYAARRGKTMTLVVGEDRGPEYDEVKLVSFSADGSQLLYGAVHQGTAFTVHGPVFPEGPVLALKHDVVTRKPLVGFGLYDVTDPGALRRWITVFHKANLAPSLEVDAEIPWKTVRSILLLCKDVGCDRVEYGIPTPGGLFETFDALDAATFVPGMGWPACIGTQHGDRRVIAAGKQGDAFKSISGLIGGGNRILAYRASNGDGWFVIRGLRGKPGPRFDEVGDPVLNADASQVAYAARDGAAWVVVAGAARSDPFDQIWMPRFEDSGTVVFAARKGREIWRKTLTVK